MNGAPAMLVVASGRGRPRSGVWGHGGWLPPEEREALDWLTLARMSGWEATDQTPGESLSAGAPWVVLACEPEELGPGDVEMLQKRLQTEALLVVLRGTGGDTHPLVDLGGARRAGATTAGRVVRWHGPGRECSWHARADLETTLEPALPDVEVWASLDGAPLITARRVDAGIVATLGFHPSRARDADGAATVLVRHLLVAGCGGPVAWLDFEGTLVLRMDDPGGAQNVHSKDWCYPKLGESEWAEIVADLRTRDARLSALYTPGWVDDGDERRGTLLVDGRAPSRRAGRIWDSPRVRYQDLAGHAPGSVSDYRSEFRGLQALRRAGRGDVELHGYTHLHPDLDSWTRADDRYEASRWYRELGRAATGAIAQLEHHPVEAGAAAIERLFGTRPTTLVPPGDEFTDEVVEVSHRLGLSFVASYYLALRIGDRFCWCQQVCAPYLDRADASWFDAGLPVVGYFHDYEPSVHGVGWMTHWLDAWQECGAGRLIDFRELAAALGRTVRLEHRDGAYTLRVDGPDAPALVRDLSVALRVPSGVPPTLRVVHDGAAKEAPVEYDSSDRSLGHVAVPATLREEALATG
jgi:hypothetical protein